ncbi:MAG: gamma-glutamyltransferase family protein [Trueperaceae bacterium]|nr:MAG: gamma-glutamyltransferase family protein [Trueperaceae bacterium]
MTEPKHLGVVAAPHHLASETGIEVLRRGGNAFDAAVAVSLAIGVVQPYHSGIGGGCSATYLTADGTRGSVGARGSAPQRLERSMFLGADGSPEHHLAHAGGLAVAVPALIRGLRALHDSRGRLPWREVCSAPVPLARDGFYTDFYMQRVSNRAPTVEKLARYAKSTPFERPLSEGEYLKQPQLAATLELLADDPDSLYTGEIGQAIVERVQDLGGVLSNSDLETYRPQHQALLEGSYRGWQILTPAVPTIGALQVMLSLQILDHFAIEELTPGSAEHLHLVAEALKLSYRARAGLTGDADALSFADRRRAAALAKEITLERTTPFAAHRNALDEGSCTSHFCVADADGNVVSQTQTVRNHFGSGVVEPTSGIVLNDMIGDFSLEVGGATDQGVRYRDYNLLEPGAEPASSQSPVLALNPTTGDVVAAGAAGGPRIVSATLQALVNRIDFGMDLRACAGAARVHCHGPEVEVEPPLDRAVSGRLEALGHRIRPEAGIAIMQIVERQGGSLAGAADPRGPGAATVLMRRGESVYARSYGYQRLVMGAANVRI